MRRFFTLFVAGGLVAASCGSSSTATEASSGEYESPLFDFLGLDLGPGNSDDQQAQMEEQQRQVNEEVTACMAAEGFEWSPDPQSSMFFTGEDEDGPEWGSDEWVAAYGFGISTQSFAQTAVGPDLIGYDDSAFGGGEEYVDPNQEYLDTLSDAERDAFYETLHGGEDSYGPEWDETLSDEENDAVMQEYYENEYEPSGCYNIAQESAFDDGAWAVFEEFSDELEDMYERVEADPRIIEANTKIAECVSDKGFTYTTMDDVYEEFSERMQPIYSAQEQSYETMEDPFEGMSEDEMAAMTEEDFMAFDMGEPPLPDESKALLAEVQMDELAMAIAVNECGGGYNNQEAIFNEVRVELEQEFLENNREALESFKSDG